MIKAILACDEKGGVGLNGSMPWPNNSRDLKWFKEHTTNHIVVMGSTTWADPHMPCPMPNRVNVVVTSNPDKIKGAYCCITGDPKPAILELAKGKQDVWIIGGPNVIDQTLSIIDKFYISRIPGEYGCDTFLPLRKIETLFYKEFEEVYPDVTFQIWKKDTAK